MSTEHRTFLGPVALEHRAATGGRSVGVAIGYAARFNVKAPIGGFLERIAPGAFTKTLLEDDVVALANHNVNLLLGRKSAGTLRLKEDRLGLAYDIDLPNTEVGRDWAELLRRRDVTGSSFSFNVLDDDWTEEGGFLVRTLKAVRLMDVGPVVFPAYTSTTAGVI